MWKRVKKLFSWFSRKKAKNEVCIITSQTNFTLLTPHFKDVVYISDMPDSIKKDSIYVVGDEGCYWMLGFMCPCGCGSIIHLNTLPDTYPSWNYKIIDNNIISIKPSIWRKKGCKSHFFVTKNDVLWTFDMEENHDH